MAGDTVDAGGRARRPGVASFWQGLVFIGQAAAILIVAEIWMAVRRRAHRTEPTQETAPNPDPVPAVD